MQFDFDGIENANVFERGKYLPPGGHFRLAVHRILTKKTRSSGPAFIAEFTVVESDHDEVKVGDRRTWYQSLQDTDIAFPAIQEFLGTLMSFDKDNKDEWKEFKSQVKSVIQEATSYDGAPEGHPLHGMEICVETFNKVTEKNKKDFTVHDWSIAA